MLLQWEDMRVLGTAFLPGHRSMNPCPVYDEFTGTLFLFFIAVLGHTSESYQLVTGKNVTRLCYICSTDDGDTWSPVTDLTKRVIGDTIKGQGRLMKGKYILKHTCIVLFWLFQSVFLKGNLVEGVEFERNCQYHSWVSSECEF